MIRVDESEYVARPALALLWAAVAVAVCAAVAPLEPSLLEEGYLVQAAQRMLEGDHLYRDIVTFTGPLPFEALALLFRLFGEEISVGRAAIALMTGAAAGAAFDLARRGGAGDLAHAAGAAVAAAPVLGFPLLSIYFYSTIAYLLCVVAAWMASLAPSSRRFAIATGVTVAAVALCKQTTGVALALGVLAAVAFATPPSARRVRVLDVVMGGAAVTLGTVLVHAARGDLGALFDGLVVLPLSLESSFSSPTVNLWPPGRLAPEIAAHQAYYMPHVLHLFSGGAPLGVGGALAIQALYALPWVAVAATAAQAARGRLSGPAACGAAAVVALFVGTFPRSDWGHLVFVLPPSVVLLCLLPSRREPAPASRRIVAWLGVAVLALSVVGLGRGLHRLAGPATFGPRVPQRPVSALYRGPALPRVIAFLRERLSPEEPIFVARMEPLVYFATGARNPTPYGGVIPGARSAQQTAILAGLEQVRFVVMSDLDRPVFTWYRDELPAVQAHLERHFRVAAPFAGPNASWISVLERGPDRGEAAIDLFDAAAGGRRWSRDADGTLAPPSIAAPRLPTRQNRRPLPLVVGERGGGIDYALALPAGAALQADLGLRVLQAEAGAVAHPDRVRLVVSAADAGDPSSFSRIGEARIDYRQVDPQRWTPLELDLSEWSGREIVLRLEVVPDGVLSRPRLAWWGSPRIVARPSS